MDTRTLEEHAVAWWKRRGFKYWEFTKEERDILYQAWAIVAFNDMTANKATPCPTRALS